MVDGYCGGGKWILWRWWIDTVVLAGGCCGGGG